jgi:hypothetical protein
MDAAQRQPDFQQFQTQSLQEASDQYHLFALLEKSLQNPPALFHSANNSLSQASREWILNRCAICPALLAWPPKLPLNPSDEVNSLSVCLG